MSSYEELRRIIRDCGRGLFGPRFGTPALGVAFRSVLGPVHPSHVLTRFGMVRYSIRNTSVLSTAPPVRSEWMRGAYSM